jgi:hypothetical protein
MIQVFWSNKAKEQSQKTFGNAAGEVRVYTDSHLKPEQLSE